MMSVVIYYNGHDSLQGRSLDISRNGMLVHTGPLTLPLYAMVEVAFPLETSAFGIPQQRATAMVVRRVGQRVGLMFAREISTGEVL